jgi:predicted metal-binding protein
MPVVQVVPVMNISVRGLCRHPYYNHPKGCPNWGKRASCPPQAPILTDLLDLDKPVYAAYNVFDFAGHCDRMQARHPGWSEHQVKCVLYWQGSARKSLRLIVKEFLEEHEGL